MRVFFSAGEASGDTYAAALAARIAALRPGATFEGVGGHRLEAAGGKLVADSTKWGAIGIVMAFVASWGGIGGFLAAQRALATGRPGLFVPIDFGFFNIKLARRAKALGWKVAYFAPPGSWRRDRQGKDLAAITDLVVTQFPWSRDLLVAQGCDAHWLGHPLKELAAARPAVENREGLAVLPGSRHHEIAANLPLAREATKGLDGPFWIGLAPSVDKDWIRSLWPEVQIVEGASEALRRARAAIVCSGTATLEAALCHCPSVIVYRGNWLMEMEAQIRRPRIAHIGLPNIILERRAVPELYLWQATPQAVREALLPLLADTPERQEQMKQLEAADGMLGPSDALTQTAKLLVERFG
ncbi:MAG: hypothetical protein JSS65_07185 [Armatimonadetes bacterium]|nr:hypothetical protein [Armatimonadota bacterium]